MRISEYDRTLTLDKLLTKSEGILFERKSAKIKISKLAEAIIGFANADGGTIAIGIKDGKVEGILSQGDVKINDILQCGFDHCVPSIQPIVERVSVTKENGKLDEIILLHISPSFNAVHKNEANEAFLRIGDETKKLNYDQYHDLEYAKGSRFYEEQYRDDWRWDELDNSVLERYRKALEFEGSYEEMLLARKFIRKQNDKLEINNAGILMFAKYPAGFLPSAKVRFFKYDGTIAQVGEKMNIIKQREFEAALPSLIDLILDFVSTQLREYTSLDKASGKFLTVPEYPEFAWQEAIINALVHRAYNIHGNDIRIFMFDDRLEIHNPGNLPELVTVDNIRETRY